MPPPSSGFSELLDKPLTELLKLLAAGKLTKDAVKWVRRRIRDLWEKGEYGFTLDPDLASELQDISRSDAYKRLRDCIGSHPYLSLVKLGLRIAKLSDEGRVEAIAKIKADVYKKSQVKGVRILRMGSTGVLLEIIRYLSEIKIKHNYSQADMVEYFEKIIDRWMEIGIFHEADYGQNALEEKIIAYMNLQRELFFVFASGIAAEQAKKAIASLSNSSETRKRGLCSLFIQERKI